MLLWMPTVTWSTKTSFIESNRMSIWSETAEFYATLFWSICTSFSWCTHGGHFPLQSSSHHLLSCTGYRLGFKSVSLLFSLMLYKMNEYDMTHCNFYFCYFLPYMVSFAFKKAFQCMSYCVWLYVTNKI